MIGNDLDANDAGYSPGWAAFDSWVVQASYFWESDAGVPYSQVGSIVDVNPGDEVTALIAYSADAGTVVATISAPEGTSTIAIVRPFPNENPPLFSDWRDFFTQAARASAGSLQGAAVVNVESHYVEAATFCSVLPFEVQLISLPYTPVSSADYLIATDGVFACQSALTQLDFPDAG